MTQGEYPYPPDEFDAVDPSVGPRGAHRRPRSRWATVWPYLVALAVSAVLAYVVIGIVWDGRTVPTASGNGTAAATPSPAASASPEPSPAGSPGGTDDDAAAPGAGDDTEPPADPDGAAEPPADGTVPDRATPVVVLNSTSVPGLAAGVAERLQTAGWTSVSSGNFAGGLPASTVRYPSADLEPSARAVADALGIAAVEPGGSAGDRVEVVLEDDFTG